MFHMSREIYEKIEELGRLVTASEEFRNMKLTEKYSLEDPKIASLLLEYNGKQQLLYAELDKDDKDFDKIGALSRELSEAGDALDAIPLYKAAKEARQEYDALMQGIADVLRSVVEPQVQCSCSGRCDNCPGCGQQQEQGE